MDMTRKMLGTQTKEDNGKCDSQLLIWFLDMRKLTNAVMYKYIKWDSSFNYIFYDEIYIPSSLAIGFLSCPLHYSFCMERGVDW